MTFRINAKEFSPEVYIDGSKQTIDIFGTSTLKNTSWFYTKVLKWIIALNGNGTTLSTLTLNIRLKKINKSSSKWLMLIIQKLAKLLPNQKLIVNWYYDEEDSLVLLSGKSLGMNASVDLNLIAA